MYTERETTFPFHFTFVPSHQVRYLSFLCILCIVAVTSRPSYLAWKGKEHQTPKTQTYTTVNHPTNSIQEVEKYIVFFTGCRRQTNWCTLLLRIFRYLAQPRTLIGCPQAWSCHCIWEWRSYQKVFRFFRLSYHQWGCYSSNFGRGGTPIGRFGNLI